MTYYKHQISSLKTLQKLSRSLHVHTNLENSLHPLPPQTPTPLDYNFFIRHNSYRTLFTITLRDLFADQTYLFLKMCKNAEFNNTYSVLLKMRYNMNKYLMAGPQIFIKFDNDPILFTEFHSEILDKIRALLDDYNV